MTWLNALLSVIFSVICLSYIIQLMIEDND